MKKIRQTTQIKNTIPKIYRWDGTYRFVSPQGQEIAKKDLKDIQCPQCHKFTLTNREYNMMGIFSGSMITCCSCDWMPKIFLEECPDEETAMEKFKIWLEAYELLGSNPDCLSLDTRQFLYDHSDDDAADDGDDDGDDVNVLLK